MVELAKDIIFWIVAIYTSLVWLICVYVNAALSPPGYGSIKSLPALVHAHGIFGVTMIALGIIG